MYACIFNHYIVRKQALQVAYNDILTDKYVQMLRLNKNVSV